MLAIYADYFNDLALNQMNEKICNKVHSKSSHSCDSMAAIAWKIIL